MLLISRVSSFLDQKKNRNINQKREAEWNVVDLERTNGRRGKREKIKLIGIESIMTFIRCHVSSELSLSSSCKSHTIASLALFKNFRLFLSLKKLWNSPIARAHSRGRIMFPALRQERKLFFDSRRLFPLRSTLGCALTRLVAMSLSQSRGDFKVPVYFQLDKKKN